MLVLRLALLGLVALLGTAPARAASPPLDPATLAGTWTGSWENLKFGSTGALGATVVVDGANVVIVYDVGGSVFGCGSVPTTSLTLVGGTDFTEKKVAFTRQDAVFGSVKVRSKKKGRLVAKGTGTCGGTGPKAWIANAKLDGTTLSGKMTIKLGGGTAKTTFTVTKP